jgi:hypothetical protein
LVEKVEYEALGQLQEYLANQKRPPPHDPPRTLGIGLR